MWCSAMRPNVPSIECCTLCAVRRNNVGSTFAIIDTSSKCAHNAIIYSTISRIASITARLKRSKQERMMSGTVSQEGLLLSSCQQREFTAAILYSLPVVCLTPHKVADESQSISQSSSLSNCWQHKCGISKVKGKNARTHTYSSIR